MDDEVRYYGNPPQQNRAQPRQQQYRQPPRQAPRRRGGALRKIIGLILVFLALFILYTSPLFPLLMNNVGPYRAYPEEATYTMQRTVTLNGIGSYTVDYAEPQNITNAQEVRGIEFSPYPMRETRYGAKWDVWEGDLAGANRRQVITMKYTVHTYTLVWEMESSAGPEAAPEDVKNTYLGDEWFLQADDTSLGTDDRDGDGVPDVMIQPTAPAISELAHDIADDKPDAYSKAKAIYDYMHENFRYSTSSEMDYVQTHYGGLPKHSLATLRDGWGDCDEQSMLMISLMRAVGIPARLEMGMLYDSAMDSWGGHAWAQVYIPQPDGSGGWYNIDVVNSEFLIRDCNRMSTYVDDGDGEHLSDYYHIFRASGNINFDESDISVSYTSSGEVRVVSDSNPASIPGFEAVLMPVAVSAALLMRKKKR